MTKTWPCELKYEFLLYWWCHQTNGWHLFVTQLNHYRRLDKKAVSWSLITLDVNINKDTTLDMLLQCVKLPLTVQNKNVIWRLDSYRSWLIEDDDCQLKALLMWGGALQCVGNTAVLTDGCWATGGIVHQYLSLKGLKLPKWKMESA